MTKKLCIAVVSGGLIENKRNVQPTERVLQNNSTCAAQFGKDSVAITDTSPLGKS